jgi:hypothetical protein
VGEGRSVYRVLVGGGRTERKRPLGTPRRRWDYYIKMDLQEVDWWGMDWIGLVQDRDGWREVVNVIMNSLVPKNVGDFFFLAEILLASQEGLCSLEQVRK